MQKPKPESQLFKDIRAILKPFRKAHDWEPGKEWNPYKGTYEFPDGKGSNEEA